MMRLRITKVDMNGYNGRDHHPERSDEGLVVLPLKLETIHVDPETLEEMPLEVGSPFSASFVSSENLLQVWTVVTEDGRTLELMDHEVTAVEV